MIIGNLGSDRRARIRGGGVVDVPISASAPSVSVSWWVGAEDRWHIPQQEVTTRQSLVEDAPVVRTAVRVPGGDVTATAHAAVQGPRELVVSDIENRSSAPVALAIIVEGMRGAVCEAGVLRDERGPFLFLSKQPAIRIGAGTVDEVRRKLSAETPDEGGDLRSAAVVALVVPLAHITRTRFALLLGTGNDAARLGSPLLHELPSGETVAKGWAVQVRRAAEIPAGNGGASGRYPAALRSLLLAQGTVSGERMERVDAAELAAICLALGRAGFLTEAQTLGNGLLERADRRGRFGDTGTTAAVVHALAVSCWGAPDAAYGDAVGPVVAAAIGSLRNGGRSLASARSAADLFAAIGDSGAAKDCMHTWEHAGRPWPVAPVAPAPPVAASAGGELVPDDPRRVGGTVVAALDSFVRAEPDGSLSLLLSFEESDRGRSIDVRRVPTPSGILSFSVRWHGARPALLWDIEGTGDVRVRCPALDPAWSGTGGSGDALLH